MFYIYYKYKEMKGLYFCNDSSCQSSGLDDVICLFDLDHSLKTAKKGFRPESLSK